MIRLAARLTAGGGREAVIRLCLTGAGLALAVTLLLGAAVAFPALHAHDVRQAWTQTNSTEIRQPAQDPATTDPLLWRLTMDRFDGQDLLRVDVGPEGPRAPVPPGLRRLPRAGEIAVSPALRELLDTTDPAMLADRFPGRVAATVGRDALASPDDLVVFVGRSPDELRDEPGVVTVRSIESAPESWGLTEAMRVVLVVGGLGLLIPVVVFVATATRLAAARREQRLAALRLAGATSRQVGAVAAVEAALAALAGTAVGFGVFLAIRPALADIPLDGSRFYPSDLRLPLGWATLIAVGVPALAVGAAMVSLRRIRISPLGVARHALPSRPKPWPLLMVAGGMVSLGAVAVWARSSNAEGAEVYLIALAFLVTILGIALSGPWLTYVVARGIARFGRRTPSLLAARRLQDNPAAGFRTISGIVLAVFVGTVFSGLAASTLAAQPASDDGGLAAGVVAAEPNPQLPGSGSAVEGGQAATPSGPDGTAPVRLRWRALEPESTRRLVDDLEAMAGVHEVVSAHAPPDDPEWLDSLVRSGAEIGAPVLMRCADAAALGFDRCDGTTVLSMDGDDVRSTGFTSPIPASSLADLPVVTVAAVTDGRLASIERARTRLELGIPGTHPITRRDIDAQNDKELRTLQRVNNAGLSATLIIAGCSLAVAVAGSIVERKRPFALLRLTGTRLSDLRRIVVAEAAAPLLMVAAASVVVGLAVAALVIVAGSGGDQHFVLPGTSYWLALVGGLGLALLVVLATLPLLNRLTALDSARFE